MPKKKTPDSLLKSRKELLPFHEDNGRALRDAYRKPLRGQAGELPPTATVGAWKRTHPLLAGLQDSIPTDRFDEINDALMSVDQLTIMVQNLQETSRADVLSRTKSGIGGANYGRGHKKDGSNQANDDEVVSALEAVERFGTRKLQKTINADVRLHLSKQGKEASERKVQGIKAKRNKGKKSSAEP